ncbi:endoplasmic reticulum lectin 1 isoform X1 [Neodiprion lecontei]|uniref:Endoplasmic reticulum lectin 1 n=1 Tax=Neodiprion lecontei TaxID=441921 RepID=A0ABM3FT98_NEOLC|nr:endoplasmic reticulum lectin 1 isoform X1 [Neodiprion lecontei]
MRMMFGFTDLRLHLIALITSNVICFVYGHDLKGFDDTVLFKINWPGKSATDLLEPTANAEPYFITTANNEQYHCLIPDTTEQEYDNGETYAGPNPIQILSTLFVQNSCSYRLESYWTYELCHGRYVRQYHEEREGKKVKVQEYYLGTFDKSQKAKLSAEYDEHAKNPNWKAQIPVQKVENVNMPYFEIEMSDGTMCDLTDKPRTIRVLYVCYPHGKHEIFSLKETSSCEYEAVVLSPLLCKHPDYKAQDSGENVIDCRPVDNAPKKPRSLVALEAESLKLRHEKVTSTLQKLNRLFLAQDEKPQKIYAIFHVDKEGQDGETRFRVEVRPVEETSNVEETASSAIDQGVSPIDVSPIQNFLSGVNCLNGGNGWWKYEFCYGRTVNQYHIERDGTKTVVNLGKFDTKKHLEWIVAHPNKRPKPIAQRKQLSHFYSDGSTCDKTGKLRQTEVKLKCADNLTISPSSVSLYLLEPKTCEYILGVESPFICDILEFADENGLIGDTTVLNFDDMKTPLHQERDEMDERIANEDE